MSRGLAAWGAACAVLLALLVPAGPAAAAEALALTLDGRQERVDAWPAVMLRADPSHTLSLEEVLAAPQRFEAPHSAHATLGLRKDPVWLRLPLQTSAQAPRRWVLDVDYPALNRVDVHVLRDGQLVQQAVLGNLQPFAQRPMASRSHALALELEPGTRVEVLMRVQTQGAMVLPITLNTPAAFHARSVNEQMLQGALAGLGLCLLIYSLGQWISLREALFLKYALLISGSLLFSLFLFGIGGQYLWRDMPWLERHAPGLFSLLATGGSFLFIEQVLAQPHSATLANTGLAATHFASRHFSRLMKGGALFTAVIAGVYVLDLIDTPIISAIVSVLGPLPVLLGLPGAVARARRRDPVGICFLLAWAVYFVATAVFIAVINGQVPVNFWTLHSFQFGATVDMLLFMRVLGLGTKAVHTAAQHASKERDAMRSLALSDALTGLANRRGLYMQLTALLPECGQEKLLALYLMDLDGFKPVNDQHGHDVGDELLVAVARRLQLTMRSSDVVARLGGDEFVVMTTGLQTPEQADELAHKLLEAFRAPFDLSAVSCSIGLTVGYALAPSDARDAAELLKRADSAMYAGKQAGKACARRSGVVVSVPPAAPIVIPLADPVAPAGMVHADRS